MDATFKVVPRQGAGSQLFIIHVFYERSVYPVVYALMERKTTAAYVSVSDALVKLAPNVNIRSVMAHYEVALRQAIRDLFPAANALGCWFHYARAVHKNAVALHLARREDVVGQRVIKMAMVLPLLPENLMAEGMQAVEMEAANTAEFEPFLRYLRTKWLPVRISVYRLPQRTNNAVESFHRDLMRIVSREHPNIWFFTECLLRVEHTKASDFHRSLLAVDRPRNPRLAYRRLDHRISLAQTRLADDGDVRRFLLHMSHSMSRLGEYLQVVSANDNTCETGLMPNSEIHVPTNPPILQHPPQPELAPIANPPTLLPPLPLPRFGLRPEPLQPLRGMLPAPPVIPRVRRRNLPQNLRCMMDDSSSSSSDEDVPAPLLVHAEVHNRQSPEPVPVTHEEEEDIFIVPEPGLEIEVPFVPLDPEPMSREEEENILLIPEPVL